VRVFTCGDGTQAPEREPGNTDNPLETALFDVLAGQ